MKRNVLKLIMVLFLVMVLITFTGCKKEENNEVNIETEKKEDVINLEDNNFKIDESKFGKSDESSNSVNKLETNTMNNTVENEVSEDALSYKEYDDKIVISYGDSFDVIYHHSNGKITSQICEYILADESEAKSFLMYLQSSDTISEVKDMNQSKNKVTVIFNESAYKDMTVDSVKESYDLLNNSVENSDLNNVVTNTTTNTVTNSVVNTVANEEKNSQSNNTVTNTTKGKKNVNTENKIK